MSQFLLPATTLAVALLLAGCSEQEAIPQAAAAAVQTTVATSTSPTAVPPSKADPERVLAHLKVLAGDIGTRVAGTDGERRAAEYIATALRDAGYTTVMEPFTLDLRYDLSDIRLTDGSLKALALTGSPEAEARGALVMAGMGRPEDFSLRDVRGKVVVVDRGVIPFGQKAANAQGAGAVALIFVNNEDGAFRGTLGDVKASIPVVGVERAERARLADLAQAGGTLTVAAAAGSKQTLSQNVVGRNGEKCEAYLGAHYDSVPEGPGANDNASGTAMILELARTNRRPGLCVIAFGAEEYGLWGSQAFVKRHPMAGVRFLLNFDMVGKIAGAQIVGDPALQEKVLGLLKQAGRTGFRAGKSSPFASSDHASFVLAGVPAVTFHSGDDPLNHDPRDTTANVDRASIETILAAGDLAISGLMPVR